MSTRLLVVAALLFPAVGLSQAEVELTREAGRHELAWYPAAVQLNSNVVGQVGTSLLYSFYVQDAFAVQARFTHRVHAWLKDPVVAPPILRGEGYHAGSTHKWSLLGGAEVAPLRGTIAAFGGSADLRLLIQGLAGVTSTSFGQQLGSDDRWFDTGLRLGAGVGARIAFGRHFALRLDVTDLMSGSKANTVQGCDSADVNAMDVLLRSGDDVGTATVSPGCDIEYFSARPTDVPLARSVIDDPAGDILHTVSLQLGATFVF